MRICSSTIRSKSFDSVKIYNFQNYFERRFLIAIVTGYRRDMINEAFMKKKKIVYMKTKQKLLLFPQSQVEWNYDF